MRYVPTILVSLPLICGAQAAEAAIVDFTGHVSAVHFGAGPVPPCGGALGNYVVIADGAGGIGQADGTSSLGAFEPVQQHCVGAPVNGVRPLANGLFNWTFDGGVLEGTYSGQIFPTSDPLIYNLVVTLMVTGGTGKFSGASGALSGDALIYQQQPPFVGEWDFAGPLDLPAVPEPASWALLIAGFGAVGLIARRRASASMSR